MVEQDGKPQQADKAYDRDERFVLPLDPETALRALLKVSPDAPAASSTSGDEDRSDHVGDSDRAQQ